MNTQDQYLTNISFQHNLALNQQKICNHDSQNCECNQFQYVQNNQNDQSTIQKYDNEVQNFKENSLNYENSYDYNKNEENQNGLIQNSLSQQNENSNSYFINQEGKQKRKYNKRGVINLKEDKTGTTKKVKDAKAGRWTQFEKQQFVDGLKQFGKDWKKVEKVIKTRTGAQIRSHAQKFFMNVRTTYKMGIDEYVNYIQQNIQDEENQKMGLDFDSNNDASSYISQKDQQKSKQNIFKIDQEEKEINSSSQILNEDNKFKINAQNQEDDKFEQKDNNISSSIKGSDKKLDIKDIQKQDIFVEQSQILDNKMQVLDSGDFQKNHQLSKSHEKQYNSEITSKFNHTQNSKQATPQKKDLGNLQMKQNENLKQDYRDQEKKIQKTTIFTTLKLARNPKTLQHNNNFQTESPSPVIFKPSHLSTNLSIEITRQENRQLDQLQYKKTSSSKLNYINHEQKQVKEDAKFMSTVTFSGEKPDETELMEQAYVETQNIEINSIFSSLWNLKDNKKGSKIDNMQLYSRFPSKNNQVIYPFPDQLRQIANIIQIDAEQIKVTWHLNKYELSVVNLVEYSLPIYIFTVFENQSSNQIARLKRINQKQENKELILNHGTLIKLYGKNINQFIFEVPRVSSQQGDVIGRRIQLIFSQNEEQNCQIIRNQSDPTLQKFFRRDLPDLQNIQNNIPDSGKTPQFGSQSLLKPNFITPFGIDYNIFNLNNEHNFNLFNQGIQQQKMIQNSGINNLQSYFGQQNVYLDFNRLNTQNSESSNNSKSNSKIAKIRNINQQNKSPRSIFNQPYQQGSNFSFLNQQFTLQALQSAAKFSPLTRKNQISQNSNNQNQFISPTNLKGLLPQHNSSPFTFENKKGVRERTFSGILNSRILSEGAHTNVQNNQSPKVKSQKSQNECEQNFKENNTGDKEEKKSKQGNLNRFHGNKSAFVASQANTFPQTSLNQSKKQQLKLLNDKSEFFSQNLMDQKFLNDKNINQTTFLGLSQQQAQKSSADNSQKIPKAVRDMLSPSKNLTFGQERFQQSTNNIIEPKLSKQAISNVTFAGHEILRHLPTEGNQRQNLINQSQYKNSFKDIKAGLLRENDQSLKQDYLGTNYERRTSFLNKIDPHDSVLRQIVYGKNKLVFPSRNVSEFSDRSVISNIMSQYTNQNNYKTLKNQSQKRQKNLDENHAIQDQPMQFIQKEQEEKENLLIKISGLASRCPSNTSDVSKLSSFIAQENKPKKLPDHVESNQENIQDQTKDKSVKFIGLALKQSDESIQYTSRFDDSKPDDQVDFYNENIEKLLRKEGKEDFEYDYINKNLNWVQLEAQWQMIFLEFSSILNEIVFNEIGISSIDYRPTLSRNLIDNLFYQVDSFYTEMIQLYQLYIQIQKNQNFNCFQGNQRQNEQNIQKGLVRLHICISQNLTMQTLLKSLLVKLQFQEIAPVYHIQKENLGYLITLRVKEFSKFSEQHQITQQILKQKTQIVNKKFYSQEMHAIGQKVYQYNQEEFFKEQISNDQLQKTSQKINEETKTNNKKENYSNIFNQIASSLSPAPEKLLTQHMTAEEIQRQKDVSFDDTMRFQSVFINQDQIHQETTPDNSSLDYLQKRQKLSEQTSGLKYSQKDSCENKRQEKTQEKEEEKEVRVRKGGFRQEAYSDCLPSNMGDLIHQKHEKSASNHLY